MRIALGSDEVTALTARLQRELRARGYEVRAVGALAVNEDDAWPSVGRRVGELVARRECESGIVCCSTGTGVTMAANKVTGVRAALCTDPRTAAGAREWNDANVLGLSLALRADDVPAILEAWFHTAPTTQPRYLAMIAEVESPSDPQSSASSPPSTR